jgi:GrxC family glutaredoxin
MKVKIYVRQWCGYCTRALHLLAQKRVPVEQIDTTGDQAMREWLYKRTLRTTVPQIFIDDRSIGGYDDLAALDSTGELDRLLGLT